MCCEINIYFFFLVSFDGLLKKLSPAFVADALLSLTVLDLMITVYMYITLLQKRLSARGARY